MDSTPDLAETEAIKQSQRRSRIAHPAAIVGLLFATLLGVAFLIAWGTTRTDGPVWVLAGGPFQSGERVDFRDIDWEPLDVLHELEIEIVAAKSSRTLWFSVHDGAPYVACELDCIGGRLTRWPQQIEHDDRVVIRINEKRVEARLVHVPHESTEYMEVRAGRERKYAGDEGGRAAAETSAHSTVIEVGEALTGRANRPEPGDRLYRVDPRQPGA
jgi:hypothetical protein